MHQVLKQLSWEEEALPQDVCGLFLGRCLKGYRVFQRREDTNGINVLMELGSATEGDSLLIPLVARCSYPHGMENHYICHSFLSDGETGTALEAFPTGRTIASICRVQRIERQRKWQSPVITEDGCVVTGIKLTFEGLSSTDYDSGERRCSILHCWYQCKTIPYCGDQMSPRYLELEILKNETVVGTLTDITNGNTDKDVVKLLPLAAQEAKEVGFLPCDFLCSLTFFLSS